MMQPVCGQEGLTGAPRPPRPDPRPPALPGLRGLERSAGRVPRPRGPERRVPGPAEQALGPCRLVPREGRRWRRRWDDGDSEGTAGKGRQAGALGLRRGHGRGPAGRGGRTGTCRAPQVGAGSGWRRWGAGAALVGPDPHPPHPDRGPASCCREGAPWPLPPPTVWPRGASGWSKCGCPEPPSNLRAPQP